MRYLPGILLLSLALASCASRKQEPVVPEPVLTAQAKGGKDHFLKYCQKCHPGGKEGTGPALEPVPATEFIQDFEIRHGLGVMPYFNKEEISEQQLRDIIEYLQALK